MWLEKLKVVGMEAVVGHHGGSCGEEEVVAHGKRRVRGCCGMDTIRLLGVEGGL
jgi:hypothetical protein